MSFVRTEGAGAQIATNGIEVCKSGPAGTVASFTITELPGTPRPFVVPAGLCQRFFYFDVTQVIIEEQPLPGLQVADIIVTPATAEIPGTRDVAAGIIGVRSTEFNPLAPNPTRVVFHDTPAAPGTVRVCKQGGSLPTGTAFPFTSSDGRTTTPFTLMRDQCGDFSFPVGTRVTLDEDPPVGFEVSRITVDPVGAEAQGRNASQGIVSVIVGPGLVVVTYTNAPVAPVPGALSVCKVAGVGVSSGTLFNFSLTGNGVTTPLSVAADGGCATVPYPVGSHVTIAERASAGFAVSQIVVSPAGAEDGGTRDLGTGVVGVTVGSGPTSVAYTNTVPPQAPGVLRVCKRGAGLPAGTAFPFVAGTGGSDRPFALLPDQCGDFSFPVGVQVTLDENPPAGFTVSQIAVNPPAAEVGGTRNVGAGLVAVTVGAGLVTVDYTNAPVAPVPAALSVCKVAGPGVASGTLFTFSVTSNGVTTSLSLAADGGCATVPYPVGSHVTVGESPRPGFAASEIVVAPAAAEAGGTRDLDAGVVGVLLGPGTTTARFTNTAAPVVPFVNSPPLVPGPVLGPVIFSAPLALTGAGIDRLVLTAVGLCLLGSGLVGAARSPSGSWRTSATGTIFDRRSVVPAGQAFCTGVSGRGTPAPAGGRSRWRLAPLSRAPPSSAAVRGAEEASSWRGR